MDTSARAEIFAGSIRFRTVSTQPGVSADPAPFVSLHDYIRDSFPRIHDSLKREVISSCSLLYTWEGADPTLDPILLSAHMDVVPAGDQAEWRFPPFSGTVREGRIWGRGTIDYKVGVMGMLQSCEDLLAEGFTPCRTVLLAFGHDEELGGPHGAAVIADLLSRRYDGIGALLDEGGYIYSYPWLKEDVAVVGLAEKGYLTLRLKVAGHEGHASIPPLRTPLGILGESLSLLERMQMPPVLCGPVRELLARTTELWREDCTPPGRSTGMLDDLMNGAATWPDANSLIRTTIAPTMVFGSAKENILPGAASALVNFRAVPGDDSGRILEHVRDCVGPLGVEVEYEDTGHVFEPSTISPMDTGEYDAITRAVETVWPGLPVVPGIFPAATDSRHYRSLTDRVLRFVPIHLGSRGLGALHSINESISIEDYMNAVSFYREYIFLLDGSDTALPGVSDED